MNTILNEMVCLLKDSNNCEFLALSSVEDYFLSGDFVKLIQFITKQNQSNSGLRSFKKLKYAIYNSDNEKTILLSKDILVVRQLCSFDEFLKLYYSKQEDSQVQHKLNIDDKLASLFISEIVHIQS